jgi:small subunit ribosomal protein S6
VIKLLEVKMVSEEVLEVEDKQLCEYELVLIVSPEVVDEKLEATVESLTQLITGKGGVVAGVEQWGKRKLAYPIKHFMEGNYVLIRFKLKPELTRELRANLQISEEFLRHLIVKLSD